MMCVPPGAFMTPRHEVADRVAAVALVVGEREVGVFGEELAEAVEVAPVDAVGVAGEEILHADDGGGFGDVHRGSLTEAG